MSWYAPKDAAIGNRKAIKHAITGELALVGQHGEIWQVSDEECAAAITSNRIANKHCEGRYKLGEEALVRFPVSDLELWCSRLKITRHRTAMIERATNFGKEKV